jgi:hypothetical protein
MALAGCPIPNFIAVTLTLMTSYAGHRIYATYAINGSASAGGGPRATSLDRFAPESGHEGLELGECPLWVKRRHALASNDVPFALPLRSG